MDPRKVALIQEFLRRKPVEEWFGEEMLRCLPTPHLLHPHLKKAILIRRLSAELSAGDLSDDTLQCLEVLEELDRYLGAAGPPPAMRSAYCAVAAELTVEPLRQACGREAGFLEAAHWIWDCRVPDLERSEGRGLVEEGVEEWRAAIKEAVSNASAREVLLQRDTRREALEAVREYLKVAVNEMGEPLLQLVARAAGAEEDDAGGSDDADKGRGERVGPAGASGVSAERSAPSGAPADEMTQMGPPASESGSKGSPYVLETERNETGELAGQIEEAITHPPSELVTLPSSVDVNKVRQALKSSCEELRNVVVDPLPSALGRAADVQLSMMDESATTSDSCENKIQTGASKPGPSLQKDAQDAITERNADEERAGIPCLSLPHHDLMDITVRTDEGGEDSNECASGKSVNSPRRTRLSTRNQSGPSLMLQDVSKIVRRRNIKRWTPQEEDALREAVKKHGKGNWKFILQCYPENFEDRTEIDLKDKWRNMTK